MNNKTRVVITGIGPVSSVGIGKSAFWEGIVQKKINIQLCQHKIDDELWDEFYCHKIKKFNISDYAVDKDMLGEMEFWKEGEKDVDLYYLIAAIKLALVDSRLNCDLANRKISLVLAHENLGVMPFGLKVTQLAYDFYMSNTRKLTKKVFFSQFYHSFFKSGYDLQTFVNLFHIAKLFNIQDYSLFINNACASGLYAIEAASQIIKNNQADQVIIAASDHSDIYKYFWFKQLGNYSKNGLIKPFSTDCDGLVFGDGGAAIILEDIKSAQKRKATIYAEYLGGGFDLESWKITIPKPGSESYIRAIQKSFQMSGINKENIDFLCPHGVGSHAIDNYEAKAINATFDLNAKSPFITTFKPYFGHTLGCSALLETIALLLSLRNGLVPPTLNCDKLNEKLNINLVNKLTKSNLKIVMKICCAFAGYNGAAIFRGMDKR